MRLLSIYAKDFLSHRETHLDLRGIDAVTLLGKNGSGKSGLAIDAITFALYGETRYSTLDNVIRRGAEEAVVRVEIEINGKEYTVERTKARKASATLALYSGKKRLSDSSSKDTEASTQHKLKDTQAQIDRLIGLSYEPMIAGPIMRQNDSGYLLSVDNAKAVDILLSLVGLTIYDRPAAIANDKYKSALSLASEIQLKLEALDDVVAGEDAAVAELANARADLAEAQNEIERLLGKQSDLNGKIVELREKSNHAKTLRETVESLADRVRSDQAEMDRLVSALSSAHQVSDTPEPSWDAEVVEISDEDVENARILAESERQDQKTAAALKVTVKHLESQVQDMRNRRSIVDDVPCGAEGIFATCQFLQGVPDAISLATTEGELIESKKSLASSQSATGYIDKYETLQRQDQQAKTEIARRNSEIQMWDIRIQGARKTIDEGQNSLKRLEVSIARDKGHLARAVSQMRMMEVDDTELISIETQIKGIVEHVDERRRTIDIYYIPNLQQKQNRVNEINSAKFQIPELEKEFTERKSESDAYKVVASAFHRSGIPRLILDSATPAIETYANRILEKLLNGRRLRLVTRKEKVKGGLKDEVGIVIEGGGETWPYEGLSGGQRFRVDFALRIALSRVLAERGGGSINTLIIDEGFGSQDEEGAEAILDAIAAVREEIGIIIVVSHLPKIIERFGAQVEVTLDEDSCSVVSLKA